MPDSHLELARRLVAESLAKLSGEWTVDGDLVRGPGTTAVVVAEVHAPAPGHLDLGFVLNRERTDVPVIWDCAAGVGATDEAKLRRAVETWTTCTAPVALELLTQEGRFANHYRGDDPDGFAGWHAIHGPWLGFGLGDGLHDLPQWAVDHPLLPPLQSSILPELDRTMLNGVKIVFGGTPTDDTAEVRINGSARPGPSAALLGLDWPRPAQDAYVRGFVLLVHEEDRRP